MLGERAIVVACLLRPYYHRRGLTNTTSRIRLCYLQSSIQAVGSGVSLNLMHQTFPLHNILDIPERGFVIGGLVIWGNNLKNKRSMIVRKPQRIMWWFHWHRGGIDDGHR